MRSGELVAGYELLDRVGHGATGRVWRARDLESGSLVAVKVLREELADDPEIRSRFVAEARLLAGRDIPCAVRVLDVVFEEERAALVAELVDGPDLRRLLVDRGPLPPGQACRLAAQIATALAAAHDAGLVHRDLKPENVLVALDGERLTAFVADFGIARVVDAPTVTRASRILGTADYLAPEVVAGERAGTAADVYALGVLLFEVVVGWRPFRGSHPAAVMEQHRRGLLERPSGVPEGLWGLLEELLSRWPAARVPAGEAAHRLARLATELDAVPALPRTAPPPPALLLQTGSPTEAIARPMPPTPVTASTGRRRRAVLSVGLALAVLAVSGTAYSWVGTAATPGTQVGGPTVPGVSSSMAPADAPETLAIGGEEERAETTAPAPVPTDGETEPAAPPSSDVLPDEGGDPAGLAGAAVVPTGPASPTAAASTVTPPSSAPPAPPAPPAAAPAAPKRVTEEMAYSVTSYTPDGAVPFMIRPGGSIDQAFTATLPHLRSVSTVVGRNLAEAPYGQGEHDANAGEVLFEVIERSGRAVLRSSARVVNNKDTGVVPDRRVDLRAGDVYTLRVTNRSAVTLGFYCAPTLPGLAQAAGRGAEGRADGPLTHLSPVSLSAKVLLHD